MDSFTEFYFENGVLSYKIECYLGNATHCSLYELSESDTRIFAEYIGIKSEDLLTYLTKRYAIGNDINEVVHVAGIKPVLKQRSFLDSSSDI